MSPSVRFLNAAAAARQLGVSTKTLRLYEQHGLIAPGRTVKGWRLYGPDDLARAGDVVALRALGLGLAQIAEVFAGDPQAMEAVLASHQAVLESRIGDLAGALARVRELRAGGSLQRLDAPRAMGANANLRIALDLPWPWGGERFELNEIRPLTYIIGPLGSGKTRLIQRLAEALPGAVFLPLDRIERGAVRGLTGRDTDPVLRSNIARALAGLVEHGAVASDPLIALIAALEAQGDAILVIDMVEQGLDAASQRAVSAYLRGRASDAPPVVVTTRSSAMLDLAAVGAREAIIFCPANHAPPVWVVPRPGAPGYEAVASCLAPPDVRARTEGMIAVIPRVA